MQLVILAGGKGSRLEDLTNDRPKPLVEVAGRSILDHILDSLPSSITEIVMLVGYLGHLIEERYGSAHAGRKITYVVQSEQKGTAHGLLLCRPHIKGRFLFMFADDLHGAEDLQHVTDYDRAMLARHVPDPRSYGVLQINSRDELVEIFEKPEDPPSNYISTGVFVLDERIFDFDATARADGELCHTSMVRQYTKRYPIRVLEQKEWIPISTSKDVVRATAMIEARS